MIKLVTLASMAALCCFSNKAVAQEYDDSIDDDSYYEEVDSSHDKTAEETDYSYEEETEQDENSAEEDDEVYTDK